jgi:hypothetical protein
LKRVWMPDTALLLVRATGTEYFGNKTGSVVDRAGVGGTGSTNTLTFASSPALK